METYVNEKVVTEVTGRGLQSLRNDRCKGIGIPYFRIGVRSVRYKLSEVYAYMESRKVLTAESPKPRVRSDT